VVLAAGIEPLKRGGIELVAVEGVVRQHPVVGVFSTVALPLLRCAGHHGTVLLALTRSADQGTSSGRGSALRLGDGNHLTWEAGIPAEGRDTVSVLVRVGLNLVFLVPGETGGMETYARELIPRLLGVRPDLELTAFVNREAAEAGDGPWTGLVPSVVVPVRARSRIQWVRGEQQLLPRLAARQRVDLVHSLASTAPLWGPFRRVVTIHDLNYRLHPEAHFGLRALGMRVLVPLAARRSHRIIAISANTRDDLVRLLKVPHEKVDVVPQGVSVRGSADATPEPEIRRRYGLGERVIVLTVSAKRRHKNLMRLLDALALLPPQSRPLLVLPGYPTPHERQLQAHAADLGITDDTRFLGWLPARELEALYRAAACFVFPSLSEGFGLPVLEAMARDVPVACSDRGAVREVAGEAARLFDPADPAAIAAALRVVLGGASERNRLREAGRERVRRFTWEATARATAASYESAVESAES
jgi:glycosyltransferase involved in cell wall biosynthesis